MASLADLATTGRMLVVTGKGGVGKSAVAAALGHALAIAGQRVLLVEVDPRESLYQLLGESPSGGEIVHVGLGQDDRRRGSGRLSLQNLQPSRVIEQMVREHLRVDMLARRVLGSSVFQHFIESAPGLKEMAVLAYAMRALQHAHAAPRELGPSHSHEGRHVPSAGPPSDTYDTIVLDAPATGHGVSLLAAPRVVARVIEQGPFGRMAQEMTAFVADPSRVGIVVVTKAEEAPAQETIELFDTLRARVDRTPELLVVNGLYPPVPRALTHAATALSPALRSWVEHRQTNDRELARLRDGCDAPLTELPMVPIDPGPRLVATLGDRLVRALDIAADAA